MQKSENIYIEKDKNNAPFLLAASFKGLVDYQGNYSEGSIVYWKFSPRDLALQLLENFKTKTEPHIPAKDLFEAIETFWEKVAEQKYNK